MFLSIIIPVYNLPKELLKNCIDSIEALKAAIGSYEIIVVDDGSAEPPMWVEQEYQKSPIQLLTKPHAGPGAARNHGIDAAKGRYLLFVDSDDTLVNGNAMQQCIGILQHEIPDILRFKYTSHTIVARKRRATFSNTTSGALFMLENNLPGSACTFFIKRELVINKNIRFSTNTYHEDEEFSTIAHYHAKTLINSNAVLYCYQRREGSITTSQDKTAKEKRLNDRLRILDKLVAFRQAHKENSNSIQARAMQRKLATLAADAIINYIQDGKTSAETQAMCTERLAPHGLYPITGNYSIKYKIFSHLANSLTGIKILRLIIPTRSR